jgi:hypothetical protein
MTSKLFTVSGITTHSRENVTVTKVRFGTDLVRLSKMLSSDRKIGVSYKFGGRDDGYLDSKRVDLVELPQAMTKLDAVKFLQSHPQFQSAEDQATIAEALGAKAPKAPKAPRTPKTPKVKAVKKEVSLDSIKSRAKKQVTAEQVVAAALAVEPTAE